MSVNIFDGEKLVQIAGNSGGGVEVDSELSETSENPVQNRIITEELNNIKKSVGDGKKKVAAAITAKGIPTATDAGFATLIQNIDKIVTLLQGTQDANAGAGQILNGYTAYVKGSKVSGTIPSQGAQTITPGTANKTIAAGQYLSGQQTIAGDANLVAANIKKGVSIFGVTGNAQADMTFKNNDVSTVGGNYGSEKNLKLVEFTPHTFTFNTPGGTATGSCGTYGSRERTLFFNAAETISNVVYLKEIQYSHGSSGYMGFRTEPQFAWNSPNFTVSYNVYNSSVTITGENRLCLFFPNASANGEYGTITVKKILAYCY